MWYIYLKAKMQPWTAFSTETAENFLIICEIFQFSVSHQPKTVSGDGFVNGKLQLVRLVYWFWKKKPLPPFNGLDCKQSLENCGDAKHVNVPAWLWVSRASGDAEWKDFFRGPCYKRHGRSHVTLTVTLARLLVLHSLILGYPGPVSWGERK